MSTLNDKNRLPLSWHNEFWMPNEVTEEELGFVLVPMRQCSQFPSQKSPSRISTSTKSSRSSSKRNSFRAGLCSDRINDLSDGSGLSRCPSVKRSRPASISQSVRSEAEDTEWDWVWETDTEDGTTDDILDEKGPSDLVDQLNEIIAKPEWRRRVNHGSPDISNRSSFNMQRGTVVAQAGVEENDPLSMVKVASAKQWKNISKKLTINFDDVEEDENSANATATTTTPTPGVEAPNPIIIAPETSSQVVSEEKILIEPPIQVPTPTDEWRPKTPESFKPTTVQELRRLCWQIKPWDQPKKTFAERQLFTSILATNWGCDADEVHPRILVGDQAAAKNIPFLKRFNITHVLNAAEGPWPDHCVNLSPEHYKGSGITYLVRTQQ